MERRNNLNLNSNSILISNAYFDHEDLDRRSPTPIEHHVSKLDTLAGIAIKYGVDVADIKKLNSLSTDLQMFALKTLQIPLPGRHPPSPCLSNGDETRGQTNYEQTPHNHGQHDLFDSFQSLRLKSDPERMVSPAMNSLLGYYGLKPTDQQRSSEGCEMTVYRKREAQCFEDGLLLKPSRTFKDSYRKTRSFANFTVAENSEVPDNIISLYVSESESGRRKEKLVRRRQKSEDDFSRLAPERVLKEDISNTGGVPAITGKGLALRPTAASRIAFGTDKEGCGFNTVQSVVLGDRLAVRKSSSTPSFQDEDASSSSSIWPRSSATITKPIFDGLQNPKSGWKNKAALD